MRWNEVFLGGMLGSAFAQQINQFFQAGPAAAVDILGTYLPASSNFFLTYLLFRTLVLVPFRMMIPHLAVRMYIFRRWLFRCSRAALSPREKAFLYTPTSIRMGFEGAVAPCCAVHLCAQV
ncbi:hypothetical protein DUNSADRAFT_16765 [Dunaliella salina]|uniref:CSC1/OSCA1-like 7TM region domain-containing protein n=1 Tax=Dunaliella salina TaxID=3046 RepID=A0ABQ7G2X5_DUNSA|nr:hypothetical protein DUNSADRAFT_16765 [Dunaliella salina]|eukprot:KAF5828955.1 hypothetical protein DUNSADRAFT_16765 [Dunaliella salina]